MAPYYMSEEQQYTACWELMESEREKSGSEILLAGNFFRIYRYFSRQKVMACRLLRLDRVQRKRALHLWMQP
ncbi:uncharacterized [Tachysurus ichikawai]